jgi:hypothetical protein
VWPTFVGLFACLVFGPCPLFLFLALFKMLSFYKVWQDFIKKVKMLKQDEDDLSQTLNHRNL